MRPPAPSENEVVEAIHFAREAATAFATVNESDSPWQEIADARSRAKSTRDAAVMVLDRYLGR